MSDVTSRIARRYAAVDVSEAQRHGSLETALTCTIRDGGKCELCRLALPDRKKRRKLRLKASRTTACARAAVKGHQSCEGWRFPPGHNGANAESPRDPQPCACPCHTDGRGQPIPAFEDWLARREVERASARAWHEAQDSPANALPNVTNEPPK